MRFLPLIMIMLAFLPCTSQKKDRYIDSLETLIGSLKEPDAIFSEKSVLLLRYYTIGRQKQAWKLLGKYLDEATKLNHFSGVASLYNSKGILYANESNFDSALHYFERSLAFREKSGDKEKELKCLSNLGGMHFMLQNYSKAFQYYEKGLTLEDKYGFAEGEYISLNNLGTIHNSMKMPEKAILYFRKSESNYRKQNNEEYLVLTYDGMAHAWQMLKQYDSAMYYGMKAKDLAEKLNDEQSLGYELLVVGCVLIEKKDYSQSRTYMSRSLDLAKKRGDKRLEMSAHGNLAIIEMEEHNMDASFSHLEKMIALQNELGIVANLEDQPKLLSEYYFRKKDFKNAYDQMYLYVGLTDSMYKLEVTGQLNELASKYETDKKEKENRILQSENRTQRATRNYLALVLLFAIGGVAGAGYARKKIKKVNGFISLQKSIVDEKQREILDSISYAKRIQDALITSEKILKQYLPEHFILILPRDLVSGDFYWGTPVDDGFIFMTADCTGHGVPGAFMSLLTIGKLNQAVNENKITRPDLIFNYVRSEIISALNPEGSQAESKDGMDAVLLNIDIKRMKLSYAAANNVFYIVRKRTIITYKGDKMPVGKSHDDGQPFTLNEVPLEKGDIIYTLTDGFADQFGGKKGKKFKYRQLQEFLLANAHETMDVQKEKLRSEFNRWKGNADQVDDICVAGIKIT